VASSPSPVLNGPLCTRNGSFQLSPSGVLVTSEGYTVQAVGGGAIQLQPNLPIEVAADGSIRQAGNAVATLEIDDFASSDALSKFGKTYFEPSEAAGVRPAASVAVHQGSLEASNVEAPESSVRLVSLMRQFEMLQKAMNLSQQMGQQAIQEVAKVV